LWSWQRGPSTKRAVANYVERYRIGYPFFGPIDVHFDQRTVLEPDFSVIPRGAGLPKDWKSIPDPLLVEEIPSPSSARYDRGKKRERYLTRSAEYWIAEWRERHIERWRPGNQSPTIERERLVWQPDPRHPPLVIEVPPLFAELPENAPEE
jgi:Uma2 family endonuclease